MPRYFLETLAYPGAVTPPDHPAYVTIHENRCAIVEGVGCRTGRLGYHDMYRWKRAVKEHLILTLNSRRTLGFMTPAGVYTENMPSRPLQGQVVRARGPDASLAKPADHASAMQMSLRPPATLSLTIPPGYPHNFYIGSEKTLILPFAALMPTCGLISRERETRPETSIGLSGPIPRCLPPDHGDTATEISRDCGELLSPQTLGKLHPPGSDTMLPGSLLKKNLGRKKYRDWDESKEQKEGRGPKGRENATSGPRNSRVWRLDRAGLLTPKAARRHTMLLDIAYVIFPTPRSEMFLYILK
ncbi:hypothetical protein Bbelb_253750 [Branchiostoma belcheri]|nr:hypothetical protein Bbelb_253750 [Branchiostoma belcheri]